MQRYLDYTTEIASARSWSQSQFGLHLPHMLSLVYLPDAEKRSASLRLVKTIVDAVQLAEKTLKHAKLSPAVQQSLKACLQDSAWPETQIARECMKVLQDAGYDHTDYELRLQAYLLHARPQNTKFHLEDVFAGMADVSKRHSKNLVMTRHGQIGFFHWIPYRTHCSHHFFGKNPIHPEVGQVLLCCALANLEAPQHAVASGAGE